MEEAKANIIIYYEPDVAIDILTEEEKNALYDQLDLIIRGTQIQKLLNSGVVLTILVMPKPGR